jgi:Arc/MetJ-type ribon-helix-helix transcriptional regulator
MAIQLTPEQEARIQAVVTAGAYSSPSEALDACIAAIEGPDAELERLLIEGLESGTMTEEEFKSSIRREKARLMGEQERKRRS